MNKQGFTLMEVLAVLLILAVIASFATPMIRKVRVEAQHYQAQSAALKLAEAIRTYYQNTKGYLIVGSVQGDATGDNAIATLASGTCNNPAASGIPSNSTGTSQMSQLFACGYVSSKDFIGLPYTFSQSNNPINDKLLTVKGEGDAAGKYKDVSFSILRDMTIKE